MNIFDFENHEDYEAEVNKLNKEELTFEYQKNMYLLEKVKYLFNFAKSKVYISFIGTVHDWDGCLNDLYDGLYKSINACESLQSEVEKYQTEAFLKHDYIQKIISRIKLPTDENYNLFETTCSVYPLINLCLNSVIRLLTQTKKSIQYLSKKWFGRVCYSQSDFIHKRYDSEFEDERCLRSFEKLNHFTKSNAEDAIYEKLALTIEALSFQITKREILLRDRNKSI